MSVYKNIEVDFVKRTIENFDYMEKNSIKLPQEITNFLNLCYGLLVLPNHNLNKIITKMPQELSYYGINENDISMIQDKSFPKMVRSMRNGFAHSHIQSLSLDGNDEFVAIAIEDYHHGEKSPHFRIELSLEQLKQFVITFSQEYIKNKTNPI